MSEEPEANTESGKESNAETQNQSSDNRRGNRGRGGNRHRQQNQQRGGQNQISINDASLNLPELREIAALFSEHNLTDFEFENENVRLRFRREVQTQFAPSQTNAAPPIQNAAQMPSASSTISVEPAPVQQTAAQTTTSDDDANLQKILSPIVGTFYRAPSPEADPFIKIGSAVTSETIVCIVEAMKLMNEIPAEIAGEIVKIYVENGQPVEYGQPLFAVK